MEILLISFCWIVTSSMFPFIILQQRLRVSIFTWHAVCPAYQKNSLPWSKW